MSLKGTSYYEMACDAGYSGEEAEQYAQQIMHEEMKHQEEAEWEHMMEQKEWEEYCEDTSRNQR